jgi:hypothetical protein
MIFPDRRLKLLVEIRFPVSSRCGRGRPQTQNLGQNIFYNSEGAYQPSVRFWTARFEDADFR